MDAIADPEVRVPATHRGPAREPEPPADGPPPVPPAERTAAQAARERRMHGVFMQLNRWMTIPMLRAGLGPWLGSPAGGWLLLMRVRGRRSGAVREVPLSYLVDEGAVWVMAGFGPGTQWYRNLLADPTVDLVLPGRTRRCIAEEVRDPETRRRMMPKLLRATGAPGYMSGCDPWHASVDEILSVTASVPLLRLEPVGDALVAGPDDPGGLGWVWRQVFVLAATAWTARHLWRLAAHLARRP
jgi:deazaflavin-dependent oxidoreductase (nitroreductase family)